MPTKYIHINGHAVYMHYAGKTTLPEVIPDFSRGRAVVMIHGAGGNGHSWHKQIAHLANARPATEQGQRCAGGDVKTKTAG